MFHDLSEFIDISNNYDFETFMFPIQYISGDLEVEHNVCLYVKMSAGSINHIIHQAAGASNSRLKIVFLSF